MLANKSSDTLKKAYQSVVHPEKVSTIDQNSPTADVEEAIQRTYLVNEGCPYSRITPQEPPDMLAMLQESRDHLKEGWMNDSRPTGVDVNDHNYTVLGKGNTLGLVAGSLTIGLENQHVLESLPEYVRVGLFAKGGHYPAIVRFSDFGGDDANVATHLMRMAIKIPHEDSFQGEQDFLTTETVDVFTEDNYDGIRSLVGLRKDTLRETIDSVQTKFRLGFKVLKPRGWTTNDLWNGEWNSGNIPSKTYYGQLPYALEDKGVFKYRFLALQKTPWHIPDTVAANRRSLKEWLDASEAKFEMQIQYREDIDSDFVTKEQTKPWMQEWVPVGTLTLARQELDKEESFGIELKKALGRYLTFEDKAKEMPWVTKSIPFHPLHTLNAHIPVGDVQQFRAKSYPLLADQRLRLFNGIDAKSYPIPFDALEKDDVISPMFKRTDNRPFLQFDAPPILHRMDDYTKVLLRVLPPQIYEALQTPFTSDSIDASKVYVADQTYSGYLLDLFVKDDAVKKVTIGSVTVDLIEKDQFLGPVQAKKYVLLKTLQDGLVFPLEDVVVQGTEQEVKVALDHVGVLQTFPKQNHQWDEFSSNAAFSRFFFYSAGSVTLAERSEEEIASDTFGPFVVNLEHLKDLQVRPGFEKYGYKAYFSEEQQPTCIEDSSTGEKYRPDHYNWEQMKFRVRQSATMQLTGINHLLATHFIVANGVTTSMALNLPVHHIIHRFCTVHTFRTAYVNNSAMYSLIPERSLFHRQTALTAEAQVKLLEEGFKKCDLWRPCPEQPIGHRLKKLSDEDKFPVHKHSVLYHAVVERYVKNWLDKAYTEDSYLLGDAALRAFYAGVQSSTQQQAYVLPIEFNRANLQSMLTQFVFVATGYHELVGSIVEFLQTVLGLGMRAGIGAVQTDVQCYAIGCALIATTSLRTPALLNTFDRYYGQGKGAQSWETSVWNTFQDELKDFSKLVKDINKNEKYPLHSFDPDNLECAVSV
eukprot:CFRG8296T1